MFCKKQEGAKNPNEVTELVSSPTNGVVKAGAPADTNNLPEVSTSTNDNHPVTNVVDVSTNTLQTATNVSAAVTNAAPVEKSAPAPTTEKSAQKTVQKKRSRALSAPIFFFIFPLARTAKV